LNGQGAPDYESDPANLTPKAGKGEAP